MCSFYTYSVLNVYVLQNSQVDIVSPNMMELEGRESLGDQMPRQNLIN